VALHVQEHGPDRITCNQHTKHALHLVCDVADRHAVECLIQLVPQREIRHDQRDHEHCIKHSSYHSKFKHELVELLGALGIILAVGSFTLSD
jgi:hypothetical protein